jgi:hypothetical protein
VVAAHIVAEVVVAALVAAGGSKPKFRYARAGVTTAETKSRLSFETKAALNPCRSGCLQDSGRELAGARANPALHRASFALFWEPVAQPSGCGLLDSQPEGCATKTRTRRARRHADRV